MPATMTLTGFDELLQALERLAPGLTTAAAGLEATIADDAVQTLRASVPVDTGRLRNSIQAQRSTTAGATVRTAIVMGAPYAHFVEFGTARTPPRPTFVPIMRRAREQFVRAVVARVKDEGLEVTGG